MEPVSDAKWHLVPKLSVLLRRKEVDGDADPGFLPLLDQRLDRRDEPVRVGAAVDLEIDATGISCLREQSLRGGDVALDGRQLGIFRVDRRDVMKLAGAAEIAIGD